jgi:hypothetical protein
VAAKGFHLMLSRIFGAAQTSEKSKVFCFFSSEKKTFLSSCPDRLTHIE